MSTPIENAMALALYSHHAHWSRERADKFAGMVCDVLRTYRVMVPFVSLWMANGHVTDVLEHHLCKMCDGHYWRMSTEGENILPVWRSSHRCAGCHETGLDLYSLVTSLGGVVKHRALVDVLCDE